MASKRSTPDPKASEGTGTTKPNEKRLSTDPTGLSDALGMEREAEVPDLDEVGGNGMASGTQTGQTTRGSYGSDQSTGAGTYMDRRSGIFGNEPVAQPDNDQENEPDPVDPKL
jgi:hypothetical protein